MAKIAALLNLALHTPWPSPQRSALGTASGRPLAQILGKMAEVTLKRRKAEVEVQRKKGSKGQVASVR